MRSNLDRWLGDQRFDAIHFHCGLHELRRAPGTTTMQVPLEEYAGSLQDIVSCLRRQRAMLIWARLTPVLDDHRHPSTFFVRFNPDVIAYNMVADTIMTAARLATNDLSGAVIAAGIEQCLADDGIHMTPLGCRVLSGTVIVALRAAQRSP
ncbi:MAG TPA: hypothetical protein VLA19_16665 [Herpetosiphonaceae bacterium]|nr:hypothetical protein [Herpetosiphonaceae bacterium]